MSHAPELDLRIGRDEIVIRNRYAAASIANDVLIAVWFVAGSALFFDESTTYLATWFFLIGSVEFLVRPVIRLARMFHVRRLRGETGHDSPLDY